MIANQNFYDTCFTIFYPTASARPKFFRAEHSATAEGENFAYGPTLPSIYKIRNMRYQPSTAHFRSQLVFGPDTCCNYKPAGKVKGIFINKTHQYKN